MRFTSNEVARETVSPLGSDGLDLSGMPPPSRLTDASANDARGFRAFSDFLLHRLSNLRPSSRDLS